MLQESAVLDECVRAFLYKDSDACFYKAAVARDVPTSECMYLGLCSVNVLYVCDSVESQGSCLHETAAGMQRAPRVSHADKI